MNAVSEYESACSPSDNHGLATQLRIIPLLDRGVKGVHVDMDDFLHNPSATILFWVPEPGNVYQSDRYPSWLQILGMHLVTLVLHFYSALAISVLFLHGLFILWVVFGALLTRSHPNLRWLHIGSLAWGILTELLPWPCPLTLLENWMEGRAGVEPYQGGFLLHYLGILVFLQPGAAGNCRSMPLAVTEPGLQTPPGKWSPTILSTAPVANGFWNRAASP